MVRKITVVSHLLLLTSIVVSGAVQNARVTPIPLIGSLSATISSVGSGWVAYEVPMAPSEYWICCWDSFEAGEPRGSGSCRLDADSGFSMTQREHELMSGRTLLVFIRVENRQVSRLRMFTSDCNIDAAGEQIHKIASVAAAESVDFLQGLVRSESATRKVRDRAVSGIGLHDTPQAIPALERLTQPPLPGWVRGQAAFWLAQVGGERGLETVRRRVWEDQDREVQKKAVFALTQGEGPRPLQELEQIARKHPIEKTREDAVFWLGQKGRQNALPILLEIVERDSSREVQDKAIFAISQVQGDQATRALVDIAKTHPQREIRKKAIFWLGQKAGKQIAATLRERVDNDPDRELREMAVFAISQRPKDESIPMLIELARTHRDPAVRKKALFWLGQSDDPRAVEAIEKILLE